MQPEDTPRAEDRIRVSVVIPTRGRPHLVQSAIASALRQSHAPIEVIVVIDGEDTPTRGVLKGYADPRLRVIELAATVGAADARNAGILAARGEWIALLDDDDEWLPQKLSRQLEEARQCTAIWPVISSRLLVRTPDYEVIRPLRSYKTRRPMSEFLFCRRSLKDGPYAMQTSTLLMPRELMLAVPFRNGLKRHQDWDWVLRAEQVPGVEFFVVDEPLVVYRSDDGRESLGSGQDWEFSMRWGSEMREYFAARAYGWFLASECASRAVKSRAGWKVYATIARRFLVDGRPTVTSAVMMAVFLALPNGPRLRVHRLARTWRGRDGSGAVEAGFRAIRKTRGLEV